MGQPKEPRLPTELLVHDQGNMDTPSFIGVEMLDDISDHDMGDKKSIIVGVYKLDRLVLVRRSNTGVPLYLKGKK
jgi:hypothetical protein